MIRGLLFKFWIILICLQFGSLRIFDSSKGIVGWVARNKRTALYTDVTSTSLYNGEIDLYSLLPIYTLPLLKKVYPFIIYKLIFRDNDILCIGVL